MTRASEPTLAEATRASEPTLAEATRASEPTLRIATRGSPLALWQAEHVAGELRAAHVGLEVELVTIDTTGDRTLDRPIWQLAGQGVFVKEVQAAVLDGRADVAVHSAKDLPSNPALQTPGVAIAALPRRGDPRDVLIGRALDDIPPGGTVATGSTRRRAQLADRRPDLTFAGLRGNIDTRLGKAPAYSAIVMAAAAVERLGRRSHVAQVLDPEAMLPQIAQGALALECREGDDATARLLAALDHRPTRRAVEAERGFLATLGGGCELPAAAYAVVDEDDSVWLRVLLATLDGRLVLRDEGRGTRAVDADQLGREVGERLLEAGGGRSLLADSGAVTLST